MRMQSRGRPRSLTPDQIADGVLALGVDEFTVRALAAHLGVSEKTLYNYAPSRSDMVALAIERVSRDAVSSPPTWNADTDWRTLLETLALAAYDFLDANPAIGTALARGTYSRAQTELGAQAGGALIERGFSAADAIDTLAMLFALVRHTFLDAAHMDRPATDEPDGRAERDRVVDRFTHPDLTPAQQQLIQATRTAMFDPTRVVLERHLAVLLDGGRAEVRTVSTAAEPPSLGGLVAPVRARLIAACVTAGIGSAFGVLPAIAIAEAARALLVDSGSGGTAGDNAGEVWWWVIVGAVGALLATVAGLGASQIAHVADAKFRYLTRRNVVDRLTRVPLGWFTQNGSAAVKRAVTDDVMKVHTLVAHSFIDATAATVGPLTALVYLFIVDWRLTLALLGFLLLCLACVAPSMQSAYADNMADWDAAQARIGAGAVELIDGIEVVKTYGTTSGVFARFLAATEDLSATALRWMSTMAVPLLASTSLFSAAGLVLFTVAAGTASIALGWSSVGGVVAVIAVGSGLPSGLMMLVNLGYATREAQAAAAHLRTVLETPALPEPGEARAAMPSAEGRIELQKVGYDYPDGTIALRDVSATLEPSTVTAIVGASGSGKTTLARLLPRFFDVTSGRVLLDGVDLRDVASRVLLGRVAFVFQETFLLRDTVAANLRLGRPEASDDDLREAARAAQIHDRIVALSGGYDAVLGEDAQLSGGERQRVAIARAILQNAPVVVLDEATAHADPESEHEVQQALSRLAAGRTVVVIAHRLHTIVDADQILVLEAGRLVEQGTHADLVAADGTYARLWRLQDSTASTEAQEPEGGAVG